MTPTVYELHTVYTEILKRAFFPITTSYNKHLALQLDAITDSNISTVVKVYLQTPFFIHTLTMICVLIFTGIQCSICMGNKPNHFETKPPLVETLHTKTGQHIQPTYDVFYYIYFYSIRLRGMNSDRFVHFTDLYAIHQDATGIKQKD